MEKIEISTRNSLTTKSEAMGRATASVIEDLESRICMSVTPLYYSADGTGNNVTHSTWGSAGADLLDVAGTAYGDGISSMAGGDRPSARVISNAVGVQLVDPEPNARNMSDMIYAWGQFIDHDLDLTPAGTTGDESIAVPSGDPTFDPNSTGDQTISFFRSIFDPSSGTSTTDPRKQPTTVTSFLDGSMVYGSDPTRAAALRTFVGGQLKTSSGDLLPFNTENLPEEVDLPGVDPTSLFLAGDVRANENVELTSLQVLFVREHNSQATALAAEHPNWTDQQLYDHARQIVIAEIQSITYNEFLPALLGTNPLTPYRGYQPKVNPGITAEFSEAAFRMGHSLLNANVDFFADDGSESHDPLDFSASADDPTVMLQAGSSADNILKYLAADNAQEVDNQVEDSFRNLLFDPTNTAGLDLYAIDIQRGRDVGLPDYNTVRAVYGLPKVKSFSQISSDPTVAAQLQQLYGNVNNVDLFVGGLAEDHVRGSSLGPTFERIIAKQFERIRDGDRFWYQRTFSGADLRAIQNTTLADVIERNTSITNLQKDVFFFQTGQIGGQVFADTNANGLLDAGERGVAGVRIDLFDSQGNLIDEQLAKSDGWFEFDTAQQATDDYVMATPTKSAGKLTTPSLRNVVLVDNSGAGVFTANFGLSKGGRR